MALGHTGKEYELDCVHTISLRYNYNDIGTAFYSVEEIPPCTVVAVSNFKVTDFNSGTTATLDVGFDYVDGTSDVGDAIVDGASLVSAVQQGSLLLTMEDSTGAKTSTAARIKVTLAETGTAASAGEGYVTVMYIPEGRVSDRTPVYDAS